MYVEKSYPSWGIGAYSVDRGGICDIGLYDGWLARGGLSGLSNAALRDDGVD